MSTTQLPTRTSRRVATRRKVVVDDDDSDVENSAPSQQPESDDHEDYTPIAPKAQRSSNRRSAQIEIPTRKRPTASRQSHADTSIVSNAEPSQVFSPPPESNVDDSMVSTASAAPKRRSVKDARAARKSRAPTDSSLLSITSEEPEALPTPKATASPNLPVAQNRIKPDVTDATVRDPADDSLLPLDDSELGKSIAMPTDAVEASELLKTPTPKSRAPEVRKIDATVTKLERPMDIVIRKRAVGVPQSQAPTEAKPRMTITYLVMTNFKSYAGRQVVGPFHASFSSVVGPNGSGKSNVIDSLLFVFGFRASKMRQGKISALIHNSADHPDLDFCEVEVHFQEVIDRPTGVSEVVPNSQLVISRRAFKNNSSKYYIDGRNSDFTAVTTFLKERGIDLDHKRFLILQGEVESIAQMKPKAANENDDGLLEYLEDIIGTSKYKAPIEEAATETETLNEVCLDKSTRVQHVEKEKNGLEDKKDKALAYIRDENDLVMKQSSLYQVYIAECGDNASVTKEAIQQIEGELKDELDRHRGAEADIEALEQLHKKGSKELQKMEKQAEALLKEVDALDKTSVKIEEKKKHLATKARKLEKVVDSSKYGIHESVTLSAQADQDISRLTGEINEVEEQMTIEDRELAKIRENLKGKTQGFSDEIAAKQKQLEPWNAKISEKQSAMAVTQSELDMLRELENAGAVAVAEVQTKIEGFKEQSASKNAELMQCKTHHKAVQKQCHDAQRSLDELASQEPALKSKLSTARQKADEARASLSATQSQGNVLAGLLRLKESGRVDGFHGRLGNLGAIDAKYDIAISTACPALDNMVVDTVESAQQCIEYLRKNNLGRANFICLDRLPKRDLSPIETPEKCPRLFDVVKSKHARFLPAFFSVLQNTIVAQDSAQADRVAYGAKRWRVVSLEGKLIDKSGTMSGGGNRVAKGAMSSKVAADLSKEQVAGLEMDRDTLEQELAALQEQQRGIEIQIRELQAELPKLETQVQKLNLELSSIDRNIKDSERRVQELQAEGQSVKSDKKKLARLESTIATLNSEIEELQSETQGIDAEISQLQEKILEIGGVKLRGQKAKVDNLREQIELLNESLSNAEIAKNKASKQRIKHEKANAEAAEDLAKIASDLEKIDEDARSQDSGTSELRKQADVAKMALHEKREELQDLKKQLEEQLAELNDTRGAEVEMRNKLQENEKILLDNEKRTRYWQEKLDKLSMQSFSDDGEEKEPEPVPQLSRDELEDLDKEELKAAIVMLEERTSQHVELSVLAEYRRRVTEYSSRLEDLNAALAARDAAKKRADDLRRLRLEGFMEGFSTISLRLKEMYQMITMGGNAELELVDSLDPFAEGILFSVMPPKKSWKNIGNLSGGEKTLSSLALVFALHHYKPTPLYVMDEIDAALDFRNVSIVAAYIKERTKNAQFIVISLRNNMFELAARLVGVYKVNHMTKSVTIENKDYVVTRQLISAPTVAVDG